MIRMADNHPAQNDDYSANIIFGNQHPTYKGFWCEPSKKQRNQIDSNGFTRRKHNQDCVHYLVCDFSECINSMIKWNTEELESMNF